MTLDYPVCDTSCLDLTALPHRISFNGPTQADGNRWWYLMNNEIRQVPWIEPSCGMNAFIRQTDIVRSQIRFDERQGTHRASRERGIAP
jgi:hypothetical protein